MLHAKKWLAIVCSLFVLDGYIAPCSLATPGKSQAPAPVLVPPPPAESPSKLKALTPQADVPPEPANSPKLIPASSSSEGVIKQSVTKSIFDEDYVLGPEDELTIVDPAFGTEDSPYTTEVKVAPDGKVSVYPVGSVKAGGLTLPELTELLNQKERSIVDEPQMVVILKKARPVHVHVLGEVVSPGLYSNLGLTGLDPRLKDAGISQTALLQPGLQLGVSATLSASEKPPVVSEFTILTALQMAGGVKDTADIRHIKFTRHGTKEPLTIDLWQMLVEGDDQQDYKLRAGDTLVVPKGGEPFHAEALGSAVKKARPVRIIGEVHRPGLYYLGPQDDLITLLAKAGGFDAYAKQRSILLSRLNHDGTVTTRSINVKALLRNNDKAGRIPVMPGDVVVVDASMVRRLVPTMVAMASITSLFALLNVVNAAMPVTFQKNLNRGNQSNQAVGNTFFGFGLAGSYFFGGARQAAPQNIP